MNDFEFQAAICRMAIRARRDPMIELLRFQNALDESRCKAMYESHYKKLIDASASRTGASQ